MHLRVDKKDHQPREERILIFYGDFVKGTIVNTRTLCVILLSNKDDRGSPR
jgi:hypothetical protein